MTCLESHIGSERIFLSNACYGEITRIILIRHAQSDYNLRRVYDSSDRAVLSPQGELDAKLLVDHLRGVQIDAIYCSPFRRCEQTIMPLSCDRKIPINYRDELIEIQHGVCDLKDYCPHLRIQRLANFDFKPAGGESFNDLIVRCSKILHETCLLHPGETVCICTHSNPFRILNYLIDHRRAEQMDPENRIINAQCRTWYVDTRTESNIWSPPVSEELKEETDLHQEITGTYLARDPQRFISHRALGVHGWKGGPHKGKQGKWWHLEEMFAQHGAQLHVPQFDPSKETSFAAWETTFDQLNWSEYDTIVAGSLGARFVLEYLIRKQIHIPRLVLCAPSALSTPESLAALKSELKTNIADIIPRTQERYVVHSKDDASPSAPHSFGQHFANEIQAQFISTDGVGHDFACPRGVRLLSGVGLYGVK